MAVLGFFTFSGAAAFLIMSDEQRINFILVRMMDLEAARIWKQTPCEDLGGRVPNELIRSGEGEAVLDFLEILYSGGPT